MTTGFCPGLPSNSSLHIGMATITGNVLHATEAVSLHRKGRILSCEVQNKDRCMEKQHSSVFLTQGHTHRYQAILYKHTEPVISRHHHTYPGLSFQQWKVILVQEVVPNSQTVLEKTVLILNAFSICSCAPQASSLSFAPPLSLICLQ